jgi:hypothetical protein
MNSPLATAWRGPFAKMPNGNQPQTSDRCACAVTPNPQWRTCGRQFLPPELASFFIGGRPPAENAIGTEPNSFGHHRSDGCVYCGDDGSSICLPVSAKETRQTAAELSLSRPNIRGLAVAAVGPQQLIVAYGVAEGDRRADRLTCSSRPRASDARKGGCVKPRRRRAEVG